MSNARYRTGRRLGREHKAAELSELGAKVAGAGPEVMADIEAATEAARIAHRANVRRCNAPIRRSAAALEDGSR